MKLLFFRIILLFTLSCLVAEDWVPYFSSCHSKQVFGPLDEKDASEENEEQDEKKESEQKEEKEEKTKSIENFTQPVFVLTRSQVRSKMLASLLDRQRVSLFYLSIWTPPPESKA
jgi:hypothetical protein